MINNAEDLKEKAIANKKSLRSKYVNIPIGDDEYSFNIAGVGEKTIMLRKFIKYEDIMEAIEEGHDEGLEAMLIALVEEVENEIEENSDEDA